MKRFIQGLLALMLVMFIGCGSNENSETDDSLSTNTENNEIVKDDTTISTTQEVSSYLVVKRVNDVGEIKVVNESDSKLYFANSEGVLYIYSLDEPSNPQYITSYDTGDIVEDIEIYNDKIYIANNQNGLVVLTLSQDNVLVTIDTLSINGYAKGVDIYDNVIYVASGYGGINMFALETLEKYDPINVEGDFTDSIVVKDNYAITSDAYDSFSIVTNLTDGSKVTELEKNYVFYEARDDMSLSSDKNTLFLADGKGGFKIFDVTNMGTPIEKSSTEIIDKDIQHLTLSNDNNLVFISTLNSGIYIYDVSDKENPSYLDQVDLNETENEVIGSLDGVLSPDGNYLYSASGDSGLIVLSLSSK